MGRYERLRPNFFSANLHYGRMEIRQIGHLKCFFIVHHEDEEAYIKKQALDMFLTHCGEFAFYGEKASLWKQLFEETKQLLTPEEALDASAMIRQYETMESFVDRMDESLQLRSFVPCDHWLFYDDQDIYKEVVKRLDMRQMCYKKRFRGGMCHDQSS